MRNWEMRARAGSEDGAIGVGGGRVKSWIPEFEELVGT